MRARVRWRVRVGKNTTTELGKKRGFPATCPGAGKGSATNYLLADFSGALLVNYSALPGVQALTSTALERAKAGFSNAVSTSVRKRGSGEWMACGSLLESAGFNCRPFIDQIGWWVLAPL